MKNIFKKSVLLLMSSFGIMSLTSALTLNMVSCSEDGIHWANYESYMSPDLMKEMHEKYSVTFEYYSTNEDILNKFSNYYDVATPATYTLVEMQNRGLLAPIPWEYFELNDPNGIKITNADEALILFTPIVREILTFDWNQNGMKDDNLLEYGIPYFLQDVMFAYKGDAIPQLEEAKTWTDIVDVIDTTKPDCDPRFIFDECSKMGLIDDSRTIYSISRLMQTNGKMVNPETKDSILEMEESYNFFANHFEKDSFLLNSDSARILEALADPENGVNAAIAFNGDILYAAQGAGLWDSYNEDEFHPIHPVTGLALDMVVINKNVVGSPEQNDVYDLVKDIVLEGADLPSDEIGEVNPETELPKYYPMMNFDYVLYTSPLNNINDYAMDIEDGYFSGDEQADLYRQIYEIPVPEFLLLELPLSNLQKSDMHWAYSRIKEKI